MYKLVVHSTHAITEINGTPLTVFAALNRIATFDDTFVAAFIYHDTGKLVRTKFSKASYYENWQLGGNTFE